MFVDFFYDLRAAGIPTTIREFLVLMEAMEKDVAGARVDHFYHLARAALVKDEKYFDKFDQVFAHFFEGAEAVARALLKADLPDEWLKQLAERSFTAEEIERLQALGFDELMSELAKRLEEQGRRHEGGNKWIGTGGTSPFGVGGYNPAGVRIGSGGGKNRAVKVWERRTWHGLDDSVEIGTRNIKVALRRLRRFAREGAEDEFDLSGTIRATADAGGLLDVRMRPERKNRIKVLLFIDVGGTMDGHVRVSEQLFSAARSEFKKLEYFYFHNCLYERVWRKHRRGYNEWIPTWEVINTYGPDYKVIFVGDATMSPYEITEIGGSIEHWNDEPGALWLKRILEKFESAAWLNPEPEPRWMQTTSTRVLRGLVDERMYPMTLDGLDRAMSALKR